MNWFALALTSTAIFGAVDILEKHLISVRLPSIHVFYLVVGTFNILVGTLFLIGAGLPDDIPAGALSIAVVAAVLFGLALVVMFLALQQEEVSRVVPLRQTAPIFVALLAFFFLDERLNTAEWLAMAITVMGAVLVSARRKPTTRGLTLGKPFFLVTGSSLMMAVSYVLAKEALEQLPVWTVFSVNSYGIAAACYTIALRPHVLRQLRQALRSRTVAVIVVGAESLATAAALAQFGAFNLGPVSLATVVLATRPFFVLVYTTALSARLPWLVDEPAGPGTVALKLAAISMIVGGVSIIALV